MEDWYTVTQDTFREHCGCGLILNQRTFGSSHIAFLKQVYPDYTFYEWLFSQPTQGFWEEVENRLSFMKWFGEIMGCVTVDDWYRITGEDIGRCSGGGLKAHYYQDSQSRMIIELNPHLSFDESKFLIHKTIAKLCAFLKQHNIRYEREYKIHPGRKNGAYRADIYLPDLRICIELDGPQHFRQVSNWRLNPLLQATRDVFKMQRMEEKGMRCIRVLQEEVLQHPDSWLDANLIPLLCVSEDKDPVYIVTLLKNKGMYDKHKELYTTQIDTAAMYDD